MAAALAALGALRCNGTQNGPASETADCGQPSVITYICPSPSDAGGVCKGTPPVPSGAPNYTALSAAADKDASFASGCMATFCSGSTPYECTCGALGNPGGWDCVYSTTGH